ncbi:MAG: hypothetical protein M0R74_04010 [Dehalococcoidia bacterium]|nr:hypothetical protein [Dehalococcoidia bacterium]
MLDYILVSDAFEVVSADVAFTNPSPCDPGLFASDHFGLVARLRLRD